METKNKMNQEQILNDEFQNLRKEIVDRYDALGLRASGEFERELQIDQRGLSISLYGASYTEQLVNGREPGRFPPIEAIEAWIGYKGIQAVDISVSSLAFLIARKIAREGTEIFKQGGTDLIDSIVTPERIQSIIDKVSVFYVNDFVLNVTNVFKEIAV